MKNMFCPLLLILFLTCFSISCSGGEPKSDITPVFLRVEGTKILNAHGARVFLRGFNSGPMKFASYKDDHRNLQYIYNFNRKVYEHYLTADDFRNIREMGANVVRLHSFLKFWTLETEKGNYDDNFLQILDRIIDDASRNGIYIIIVMAQAGQNNPQNENEGGFGNSIWTDEDLRNRVISAWRHVAQRYVGNPCVAGYDILNEPSPPSKEALYSFYSEVITAIRSVDSDHIVFLDRKHFPKETDIRWGGIYNDKNIVLQTHEYVDAKKNQPANHYPTRQELEQGIKEYLSWTELQERPLLVGEFSAIWDAGKSGLQWTDDMIELMNKQEINWTYFSYKSVFGTRRGLYRSQEWWLRDWTAEQKMNLTVTTPQLKRLLTSKYEINPDVKRILERGFQGKGQDKRTFEQGQ